MVRPERVLVHENTQEGNTPGVVVCTCLDTGQEWTLKYWPVHKGADGDYDNPACKMEPGKCYKIGLRHSSRAGYAPEWMIREAEEIPPEKPPRIPTKDEGILWQVCLKEAGESLRNEQTIHGGNYDTRVHLEHTEELFRGTMTRLAAYCAAEKD